MDLKDKRERDREKRTSYVTLTPIQSQGEDNTLNTKQGQRKKER